MWLLTNNDLHYIIDVNLFTSTVKCTPPFCILTILSLDRHNYKCRFCSHNISLLPGSLFPIIFPCRTSCNSRFLIMWPIYPSFLFNSPSLLSISRILLVLLQFFPKIYLNTLNGMNAPGAFIYTL